MHLPKLAEKYFDSPFFKMAANGVLKSRSAKGAYEVPFPTNFDTTVLIK